MRSNLHPATAPLSYVLLPDYISSWHFWRPCHPSTLPGQLWSIKKFLNKIYCWCVAISIPPLPHWVVYYCLTSSHHGTFGDPATPPHCHFYSGALRNFSTKASVDALWSPSRHHPTELCIISSHHGTFADPATPPHCHCISGSLRNFWKILVLMHSNLHPAITPQSSVLLPSFISQWHFCRPCHPSTLPLQTEICKSNQCPVKLLTRTVIPVQRRLAEPRTGIVVP